jgi:SAM-dependent methyltransferase
MWQDSACPLCAGCAAEPLLDMVVRCRDCGLTYTNPRPMPDTIGSFYPDDYTPYQSRRASRHSPFFALLPTAPGGRLLDFGCGAGRLLQALYQRGWQVTGIDRSPRMVERIRALGLNAIQGTLPHPDLAPGSFHAITMAESLEHVHDPLGVLGEAHRLLRPGGKLVLSVPNIAGLPFHWFQGAWFGLDMPRHLTHFEPQTLGRMLDRAGFRVERIAPIRHNSWLRHSARRAKHAPFWCRLLRYRLAAGLAGWYCAIRRRCNGIFAVAVR